MHNLLEETKMDIVNSGHTVEDIIFIGSLDGEYSCTWAEFQTLADFEYNNSYGSAFVAQDLVILFSDNKRMWRYEYDGSEWWVFSDPDIDLSKKTKPIIRLGGGMWETLETLNNDKKD